MRDRNEKHNYRERDERATRRTREVKWEGEIL